jgi:hypothetical protein
VDKATADPARAATASVEKAARALEKAVASKRRDGDARRWAAVLEHGGDAGRRAQGCHGEQ